MKTEMESKMKRLSGLLAITVSSIVCGASLDVIAQTYGTGATVHKDQVGVKPIEGNRNKPPVKSNLPQLPSTNSNIGGAHGGGGNMSERLLGEFEIEHYLVSALKQAVVPAMNAFFESNCASERNIDLDPNYKPIRSDFEKKLFAQDQNAVHQVCSALDPIQKRQSLTDSTKKILNAYQIAPQIKLIKAKDLPKKACLNEFGKPEDFTIHNLPFGTICYDPVLIAAKKILNEKNACGQSAGLLGHEIVHLYARQFGKKYDSGSERIQSSVTWQLKNCEDIEGDNLDALIAVSEMHKNVAYYLTTPQSPLNRQMQLVQLLNQSTGFNDIMVRSRRVGRLSLPPLSPAKLQLVTQKFFGLYGIIDSKVFAALAPPEAIASITKQFKTVFNGREELTPRQMALEGAQAHYEQNKEVYRTKNWDAIVAIPLYPEGYNIHFIQPDPSNSESVRQALDLFDRELKEIQTLLAELISDMKAQYPDLKLN